MLTPKYSRLPEMNINFLEIEKFFRALKADSLTEAKDDDGSWKLSQVSLEGRVYDLLGSLDDWCDFFSALAKLYLPDYNDKPLRKLISKLRLNQAISMELVKESERVLAPQRKLFLGVPSKVFNDVRNSIYYKDEIKV